jgi:predicted nuclease with TOPRIM domain
MNETKKKDWLFIGVILILGFVLGYFIFDDVKITHSNELLQEKNQALLDSITIRNAKTIQNNDSIKVIKDLRAKLDSSIKIILDADEKIDKKYEDVYLNVDTVSWNKLDSLSTIIIQSDSLQRN